MSSFISCPDCKRKLKVPESMAGKSFRCPACKSIISAEDVEEEAPSPSRAIKTASSPRTAAALPRSRQPREEDELEDDLEPEEEEPLREKPRRKRRPIRKQSSTGLIVGLNASTH